MTAMVPVEVFSATGVDMSSRFGAGTGKFMRMPVLGVTSETYMIGEKPVLASLSGPCQGCTRIPPKKMGSGADRSQADTMSLADMAALERQGEGFGIAPYRPHSGPGLSRAASPFDHLDDKPLPTCIKQERLVNGALRLKNVLSLS